VVIDCYTTAQVATLQSAKHQLPLQTRHIDGSYFDISLKISVIFQDDDNDNNNNNNNNHHHHNKRE
jgi:hypothetical protein